MDAKEVLELKRRLEEEFRKDSEALDRVLALLSKQGNTPATSTRSDRETPAIRSTRTEPPQNQSAEVSSLFGEAIPVRRKTRRPSGFGRERDSGLIGIAKKALPFVPAVFGRKDLIRAIHDHFPEWRDKTTKDGMNGAFRRLLGDRLVELKVKAAGKRAAVYHKIM